MFKFFRSKPARSPVLEWNRAVARFQDEVLKMLSPQKKVVYSDCLVGIQSNYGQTEYVHNTALLHLRVVQGSIPSRN